MRSAARTHHFRPLHLNAAPLDLLPARFQTLDYITKARRIGRARAALTHSRFTRHRKIVQNGRTDWLPYQASSKADLSPNLCQKRAAT